MTNELKSHERTDAAADASASSSDDGVLKPHERTRCVMVGNVPVGGGAPVAV